MDWIIMIVSAVMGFISGIAVMLIGRRIDQKGSIKIYAKIVYDQPAGKHTWGFRKANEGIFLNIPLWLEIQNSTNVGRVFRDVNLVLYNSGYEVAEMIQINKSGSPDNPIIYANKGSYSFSIKPRSVSKYSCYFVLKMNNAEPQYFNRICLRYFDEQGKKHVLAISDLDGNWEIKDFSRPENWLELSENIDEEQERNINMSEEKISYLQMIQEPIGRMSTASAIFKGFAATIVAGIAALSYCKMNNWILGLSFVPVLLFFFLDIYYLKLEKKYRYLYERVRIDEHPIDFSMQLSKNNKEAKSRVIDCLKSPSIWLFYPVMIAILIIVYVLNVIGVV